MAHTLPKDGDVLFGTPYRGNCSCSHGNHNQYNVAHGFFDPKIFKQLLPDNKILKIITSRPPQHSYGGGDKSTTLLIDTYGNFIIFNFDGAWGVSDNINPDCFFQKAYAEKFEEFLDPTRLSVPGWAKSNWKRNITSLKTTPLNEEQIMYITELIDSKVINISDNNVDINPNYKMYMNLFYEYFFFGTVNEGYEKHPTIMERMPLNKHIPFFPVHLGYGLKIDDDILEKYKHLRPEGQHWETQFIDRVNEELKKETQLKEYVYYEKLRNYLTENRRDKPENEEIIIKNKKLEEDYEMLKQENEILKQENEKFKKEQKEYKVLLEECKSKCKDILAKCDELTENYILLKEQSESRHNCLINQINTSYVSNTDYKLLLDEYEDSDDKYRVLSENHDQLKIKYKKILEKEMMFEEEKSKIREQYTNDYKLLYDEYVNYQLKSEKQYLSIIESTNISNIEVSKPIVTKPMPIHISMPIKTKGNSTDLDELSMKALANFIQQGKNK